MPSDHEIRGAVRGMIKEDPLVMGMLNAAERAQLAIAALCEAERARSDAAMLDAWVAVGIGFIPLGG